MDRAVMFLDIDGTPLNLMEWADRMETRNNLIERTHFRWDCDIYVSTRWSGINMAVLGGPPQIFETMIFDRGNRGSEIDGLIWRYATRGEAEAGHNSAVEKVETYLLKTQELEKNDNCKGIPSGVSGYGDNITETGQGSLGSSDDPSRDFGDGE